jgi:selenocysteine-specific elongation factor
MKYTIVGVIGHIDHGKTSLVAALTGTDTDTHPEEKRRGITIDLGFASFTNGDHQFALIDAPGHQKYIGNLLAGVSGVDIGLLVVACDQGIQEQTLEHASILQVLGVKRLIAVLSRTDLATEETQAELREELELFLDDCGFQQVPMIAVSTVDGSGLPELQQQLQRMADECPERTTGSYFRMPVDRTFTIPGRGCILAGTVWSGSVQSEDALELLSTGETVRVREVEVHDRPQNESRVGYRTALNVTGVSAGEVQRGDELLQPGVFTASQLLLAELKTFATSPELKCPATVQVHLAAGSCSGRITGVRRLFPDQSTVVAIETERPVVATYGQKILLRLPYPVGTVGGATVLAALSVDQKRRHLIEFGEKIALSDPIDRLVAWTDFQGELQPTEPFAELQLGVPGVQLNSLVDQALTENRVVRPQGSSAIVSTTAVQKIQRRATSVLTAAAEENQDAWMVTDSLVRQLQPMGSETLVRWCIDDLIRQGRLVKVGQRIAIASEENALSKKQQKRMEQIVGMFDDTRSPPGLADIANELQLPLETVRSLSRFAVQAGLLLDTGFDLLVSHEVFSTMCRDLQQMFEQHSELSVAEIRDGWGVTRKHAIPFLEFCDRENITVRSDNIRTAGPALSNYL